MYLFFKKYTLIISAVISLLLMFVVILVVQVSRSPSNFPVGTVVTIPDGTAVKDASHILAQAGVIRSASAFIIYNRFINGDKGIKAGSFLFDKPESVLRVAYRTAFGIQNLENIKITIPEGSNFRDITKIISKNISGFASSTRATNSTSVNGENLYSLAKSNEGFLFPDTYYFYSNTTPDQIILAMRSNFNNQIKAIATSSVNFSALNHITMNDIVKMASIVEKEATSTTDRKIIAGILWKRIADNYPLQVDPPFYYFLGKDSSQLTLTDLAVDSPYNLYKNKGLPLTPIDNPGLDALFATVNPTVTKYWYYLSDKKGGMHYAITYDQHLANKAKYVN